MNSESLPPSRRANEAADPAAARSDRAARPKVAVDTVVFAVEGGRLKTYLVQLRRGAVREFPRGEF